MPKEVYVVVYHDIEDGGRVDMDVFQNPTGAFCAIYRRFKEELGDLPSDEYVTLGEGTPDGRIDYFCVQRGCRTIYECFMRKEYVQTQVQD